MKQPGYKVGKIKNKSVFSHPSENGKNEEIDREGKQLDDWPNFVLLGSSLELGTW